MTIIQMKTHKSYIIKKRSNNKVSFVEFIFDSRQFKLMTTGSQPRGARWPRFNCVQMIETMSLVAAMAKKHIHTVPNISIIILNHALTLPQPCTNSKVQKLTFHLQLNITVCLLSSHHRITA